MCVLPVSSCRVAEKEPINKMSLHNLATVFGPTLLRPSESESTKGQHITSASDIWSHDVMAQVHTLAACLSLTQSLHMCKTDIWRAFLDAFPLCPASLQCIIVHLYSEKSFLHVNVFLSWSKQQKEWLWIDMFKSSLLCLPSGPGAALLPAAFSHLLCRTEAEHTLLFHWCLSPAPFSQNTIWRGNVSYSKQDLGAAPLPHLSSQLFAHLCTVPTYPTTVPRD